MEDSEKNSNNSIANIFGIPPAPAQRHTISIDNQPIAPAGVSMADEDYSYARENMRDAIAIAMQALNDAAAVASQSQQANSFVSVAQIAKSVTDASKTLLELSRTHQEISGPKETTTVVNNNNLYMTTAEFIKKIKDESGE